MKSITKPIIVLAIIAMIFEAGCKKKDDPEPAPTPVYGNFTDPRDGHDYITVELGTQTWFAENLNYDTIASWCFADDSANAEIYGRLYTFETAKEICPDGWHLPDYDDWGLLIYDNLGGYPIAGGKLKEADTLHWKSPNLYATNESGFTALPGGYYNYSQSFIGLGETATFWSTRENDSITAYKYDLYYNADEVHMCYDYKWSGRSVRCVKD